MRHFLLNVLAILVCSSVLLIVNQAALGSTEASPSPKSEKSAKAQATNKTPPKTGSALRRSGNKFDKVSEIVVKFFQQEGQKQFGITDPQKEIRILRVEADPNFPERRIARAQQLVGDVPVFGARATLMIKPEKGKVRARGKLTPTPNLADVKTIPTINWLEAVRRAIDHYHQLPIVPTQCNLGRTEAGSCRIATQLSIFEPTRVGLQPGVPRLAWMVRVGTVVMFIDAHTGSLIFQYTDLQSVRDRLTYDLNGEGMGSHGVLVLDENTPIDGAPVPHDAKLAHKGAAKVYEFFKNLGHEIYAPQTSNVRVDMGSNTKAMWHPDGMVYYGPQVPDAGDIAGHEFTHGVVRSILQLDPDEPGPPFVGEQGAINESFADYFGAQIEGTHNWTIGESLPDGPLRDMKNPHRGVFSTVPCDQLTQHNPGFYPTCPPFPSWNYGQPDHYTEKVTRADAICEWSPEAQKDCPHLNNGIFNKAMYLASVGGNHHGIDVKGIKSKKLTRILYASLLEWDPYSADMGTTAEVIATECTELASEGKYQIGQADCTQVKKAFEAVGLPVP